MLEGQASIEMTLAMVAALLLFLGSFRLFLWTNERLYKRQASYEGSRADAAGDHAIKSLTSYEPRDRFRVFNEPD